MKVIFDETSELELRHPVTDEVLKDKKGNAMIAVIYGKHSAAYKNAHNNLVRELQKKGSKNKSSLEDAEEKSLNLIAACVKEFRNLHIEYADGKFLDPNDVLGTLKNAFWIKDQIDRAVFDLENFMQKP